jgi:hypothetical protein
MGAGLDQDSLGRVARGGRALHLATLEDWNRALVDGDPSAILSAAVPDRARVVEAARRGVRALGLSLHGARREVHDWHAGAEGAFGAALDAVHAARSVGMQVGVVTRVTRSNARVLGELPSLLRASGVALWVLVGARARTEDFTSAVTRLGLGVPPMLAALQRARRMGLDVRTAGFPECGLGPFAVTALPSAPRAHGAPCAACPVRPRCPGVDEPYLARFGPSELRAVENVVPRATVGGLAAAFVGVDDLLG